MYMCFDCDRTFEAALNKQAISLNMQWVCPYCLSAKIDLVSKVGDDLQDESCGNCDDCELTKCVNNSHHVPNHKNCPCVLKPDFDNHDGSVTPPDKLIKNAGFFFPEMGKESFKRNMQSIELPAQNSELSFEDLQLNEFVLLAMDALKEFEPDFEKGESYITDMNSRFLHTFIDGCFVP